MNSKKFWISVDGPVNPSRNEMCLEIIVRGTIALERGDFELAERLFRGAQVLVQSVPPDPGPDLLPLTLYSLSLLRLRQGRPAESQQLREQATTRLENSKGSWERPLYQYLMADVLFKLDEYRRAIPFCEQAIQSAWEKNGEIIVAAMLLRAGICYGKSGLKDHAAVALRGAVKIFRDCPGDPRLQAALIALGNALRKNSPAEAEACYREVAEWHTAKGEMQSATVAWVNLGILCSEQGRHAESLEYYQRALRAREGFLGTPRDRLGTALNNIANCYRRMEKFTEAHQSIDRAIALLEPLGGPPLASAYGTRGLIFRDEGRDAEAVEWLQKAYAVQTGIQSPNLETVAEDLEHEIAALRRLGRLEEAAGAEERLASVRAKMEAIRPIERDLTALKTPTGGAVLIELGFGNRPGSVDRQSDCRELIDRLSEAVESEQVGLFGGRVVIPENTTLMLYGPDAEALFRVAEPILRAKAICGGAIVTIRQGDRHRKVVLSSLLN